MNNELDEKKFWSKIKRFALRLGQNSVEKILVLYYVFKAKSTPNKAKALIVMALAYFILPFDAIPDVLGPLGFTDDLAVIGIVYKQISQYIKPDIIALAKQKTRSMFKINAIIDDATID